MGGAGCPSPWPEPGGAGARTHPEALGWDVHVTQAGLGTLGCPDLGFRPPFITPGPFPAAASVELYADQAWALGRPGVGSPS